MTQKNERNIKADVIRGFAIITVILGHCIQEGNGIEYSSSMMFFSNKAYQFIYSFHMPLFMLIAGWFAYLSISGIEKNGKSIGGFIGKKTLLYLLPVFLWSVFEYVRGYIVNTSLGNETGTLTDLIPSFFSYFLRNLWFLWAVFVCLIIVTLIHFYLKDSWIAYAILFVAAFFITDDVNLGMYKYLLPYYVSAFYIHKNKDRLMTSKAGKKTVDLYRSRPGICLVVCGLIFAGLFLFYRPRAFIYMSGYTLINGGGIIQFAVDMYRMIIGFAGSLFFILLWSRIVDISNGYSWKILTLFGKNSLGIYILQGYYILLCMVNITNSFEPGAWRIIIETICIAVVSLVTTIIMDKIPIIRCMIGKPFFKKKTDNK